MKNTSTAKNLMCIAIIFFGAIIGVLTGLFMIISWLFIPFLGAISRKVLDWNIIILITCGIFIGNLLTLMLFYFGGGYIAFLTIPYWIEISIHTIAISVLFLLGAGANDLARSITNKRGKIRLEKTA